MEKSFGFYCQLFYALVRNLLNIGLLEALEGEINCTCDVEYSEDCCCCEDDSVVDWIHYNFSDNDDYDGYKLNYEGKELNFYARSGASKIVFLCTEYQDFVLKIPFFYNYNNYCEIEHEIYQKAKESSLEEFFAEVFSVETDIPGLGKFYIMRRADNDRQELSHRYSTIKDNSTPILRNSEETLRNPLEEEIDIILQQQTNRNRVQKLVDFLIDNDVEDFHFGNIGFLPDKKLILIDYSGFKG